ncbi:hypothetical protein A1O1_00280 [Capronia coronata CBS 617.96]|uniref:Nuclear fusion protein KAR5 n=1 Tax=Capronia coronata CBS 617.96 TaxID=1182541 RepID=W9Z0R5_9EURO|nr:uncharacterized protein A1O1_00280 [Capronia coronata CBS 617.96]EXJ95161.1 hypothetical protein A1O1_00280 [Capronia coronata CBS 617.96]
MGFAGASRVLTLLSFLILVNLLLADVAQAKSFLKADLAWIGMRKANDDLQPNLTDLLAFRDPNQDPVLKKAMVVIDNLATRSTCHQSAAAQLLITCKAVGKDLAEEQGKHELLERGKSVYAVRVAVCETGEGRAAIPASCESVVSVPRRSDQGIEVVSGKLLSTCLEALMGEHYYWTSYSNNRQDANTLCQAGSLEATRLEALRSYGKLAELIPEFRDALLSARSQWQGFMKQQEEEARLVNQLQQKYKVELKEQHKIELGALRRAMNVAKEGLDEVSRGFQQSVAKTGSDIGRTQEVLGHVLTDFGNLRSSLANIIEATAKNHAEAAAAQAKDMHSVHALALATTEVLSELQANEIAQDLNELFQRVKAQLNQVLVAQALQLTGVESHLALSKELTEAQKASLVLGEDIKGSTASLASELDSASLVAGRVSCKLDKVNQALAQVEKASSVLTTISAMLSIPSQFAEHLHLKLLVFFATLTMVLYFWTPRKYSYSVMATYVFLEELMSLATEYHGKISSVTGGLRSLCHAIASRSLEFIDQHMPFFALVGFFCLTIGLAMWTSCNTLKAENWEVPLTSKETILDEDCTTATQYYKAHRLRNGRLLRANSDRFIRAATVG